MGSEGSVGLEREVVRAGPCVSPTLQGDSVVVAAGAAGPGQAPRAGHSGLGSLPASPGTGAGAEAAASLSTSPAGAEQLQLPCLSPHLPVLMSFPSLPTAKAIGELKELNHSERFRETFLPGGQPLLPGTLVRRPDLAALLQLLGAEGASAFYSGNLTQEIISEVSHACPCLCPRPGWGCHLPCHLLKGQPGAVPQPGASTAMGTAVWSLLSLLCPCHQWCE